jgi:hypothetical protein
MAEQKLVWRKSSYSSDGACVETATTPGHVLVRDSKDRDGRVLTFTFAEWKAFLQGVRGGEFEVPNDLDIL